MNSDIFPVGQAELLPGFRHKRGKSKDDCGVSCREGRFSTELEIGNKNVRRLGSNQRTLK